MSSYIDLIKTLFTLEQEALHDFLFDILVDHYGEDNIAEDHGQFLFAKGNLDVLLVAHLDTVHKTKPTLDEIFYDQEKGIMWSPRGIGGDDRCGVFIILNLLFKGYKPHIAFTWNEEIGCVGSRNMVTIFDPKETMGANINFAIQFDRKGHQEAVYYDLDNQLFEDYITKFGFETKIGSFTDICEICPEWKFAGVNLSAGYANEHTTNEMVFLATIQDTFTKACAILDDQIASPQYFEYKEYPPKKYSTGVGYMRDQGFKSSGIDDDDYWKAKYGWDEWDDYSYSSVRSQKKTTGDDICQLCGQQHPWYSLGELEDLQKVCSSCYNIYIGKNYNNYFEDDFLDDDDDGNDLVIVPQYNKDRGVY